MMFRCLWFVISNFRVFIENNCGLDAATITDTKFTTTDDTDLHHAVFPNGNYLMKLNIERTFGVTAIFNNPLCICSLLVIFKSMQRT